MQLSIEKNPEGWSLNAEEISVGVYRVEGVDLVGRKVSRVGVDLDNVLELVLEDINEMAESKSVT